MLKSILSGSAVARIMIVVAILATFAGSADAQSQELTPANLEVVIGSFNEPIRPLSGVASVDVTVKWSGRMEVGKAQLTPIRVTLSIVNPPTWVSAILSPSQIYINPDQADTSKPVEAKATLTVSTLGDAPAMTPGNIDVKAVSDSGDVYAAAESTGKTTVTAAYFGLLDVSMPTTVQLGRPQEQVAYPIVVRNLGNGETKMFFRVLDKPDGWQVVEPSPITLGRGNAGKPAENQVMLMIQTPKATGYLNEVKVVNMEITSVYAFNPDMKGDRTVISVLTTTKGFDVPGLGGLAALAPLAVAAVVRTARRRTASQLSE